MADNLLRLTPACPDLVKAARRVLSRFDRNVMCLPSGVQPMFATLTCPVINGVEFPLVSTTCNSVHEPPSFSFAKSRGTLKTYVTCEPSGAMTASVTIRSLATCCGVKTLSGNSPVLAATGTREG